MDKSNRSFRQLMSALSGYDTVINAGVVMELGDCAYPSCSAATGA